MRFIIVDMTHGGKILAEELITRVEVIGIDIYNTMNDGEKAYFYNKKIPIKANLDEISLKNTDIIIAPVHCDPKFLSKAIKNKIPIFSFHKMVGNLLRSELTNKFILEITGTRGKTTTALSLASLLSYEKNILCLSSRGLELFRKGESIFIDKDIEIAPPYLLKIKEYLDDFEIGIFEISLGGTGLADIGIITNIIEDYPIANSKKSASSGKKQILELAKEDSLIFYNIDDENTNKLINKTNTLAKTISFGECGDIKAKIPIVKKFHETINLEIKYDFNYNNNRVNGKISSKISTDLIGIGYFYAYLIYIGIAIILDINTIKIKENLNEFKAIENRLNLSRIDERWLLKDINSGVDHNSILMVFNSLKSYLVFNSAKLWLVLDINSAICEKISEKQIQKIISDWKFMINGVFSRNSNIGKPFQDLNLLIGKLIQKSKEKDIIFIVKKTKG